MSRALRIIAVVAVAATSGVTAGTASAHTDAATQGVRVAGTGVLRLGTDFAAARGYERWSYVIVGPADARRASRLPGTSLVYRSAMDVDTTCKNSGMCASGVSFVEAKARNPGWVLKDAQGRAIFSSGHPHNALGDVGDRRYQQRWAENVARFLRRHGARGIFIDNVLAQVDWWSGGRYPAKYPTNAEWEEAMARFVSYVGPALRAKGFYVLASAFKYGGGRASSDSTVAWWERVGPAVSGLMSEYWLQNPNGVEQLYNDDPTTWTGHWTGWLRLVRTAQDLGRDFFGLQYGTRESVRTMRYGRASFLLEWDGRGGAYIFHIRGGSDPWSAEWATDVGRPLGRRHRSGVAWRRDFSWATVLLNPSPSTAQHVTLRSPHALPDGSRVRSVTLPPTSALVLRTLHER